MAALKNLSRYLNLHIRCIIPWNIEGEKARLLSESKNSPLTVRSPNFLINHKKLSVLFSFKNEKNVCRLRGAQYYD